MALVALCLCALMVVALFLLNRDSANPSSKALWLPVLWLGLIGSRPVSVWLGSASSGGQALDAALEGNTTDAVVLSGLVASGLIILVRRRKKVVDCLRGNLPVVIFFVYCLISVTWSPFPDVAFKRWVRAIGDLVMVIIVLTDARPAVALSRLFSRIGFVLLPASLFLVRYSDLGRGYDPDGNPMNTGVTTNKNTLGLLAFVVGVNAFWAVVMLLRRANQPNRWRRLTAQCSLLILAITILSIAHSATSVACFVLGAGLILVTNVSGVRSRPWAVHTLIVAAAVSSAVAIFFGGQAIVFSALGRDSSLTGRTEIWSTVISLAINPVIGAGFESFWNASSEALRKLPDTYQFGNLNSAHNGYIEIYLNLGVVGLALMGLILVAAYRHSCAALRRNPAVGGLLIACTITTAVYCITEAGLRTMSLTWICLLLACIGGSAAGCSLMEADNIAGGVRDKSATPLPPAFERVPKWRPREAAHSNGRSGGTVSIRHRQADKQYDHSIV
jgi:exopolysaccharide production protein ExoQ